jgi:hypothetical protein
VESHSIVEFVEKKQRKMSLLHRRSPSPSIIWLALALCCALLSCCQVEASQRASSLSTPPLKALHNSKWRLVPRGGSTATAEDTEDEEAEETVNPNDLTKHADFSLLQSYRMRQQFLLQLRATYLSEALAIRGIPLPTLKDVATPTGAAPPKSVDWDCAMSTLEEPKSCMFSLDAEMNTKVIAPLDSSKWMSVGALNRLRRTDPTKVEPMWHSQYDILKCWFDTESEYSILQHVGVQGFLLNALLQGFRLHVALALSLLVTSILFMPILEYMVNRFLVSGLLWSKWTTWGRFVHGPLPLRLLIVQYLYKQMVSLFLKLVGVVKERLVEVECLILEQRIPLTVGPGSEVVEEEEGEESETEDLATLGQDSEEGEMTESTYISESEMEDQAGSETDD